MSLSRRDFVRSTTLAGASLLGACSMAASADDKAQPAPPQPAPATKAASTTANSRPGIAVIGCGGIARWHGGYLKNHVDVVALADVDAKHLAAYNKDIAAGKAFTTPHYQDVLTRNDVDLVLVTTPDHWHV